MRRGKIQSWDKPHRSDDKPAREITTVHYTYTLEPAPWARDETVQHAFPILARVVKGSGSMELTQEMVVTDGGWKPL